jgi:hypothetical protein
MHRRGHFWALFGAFFLECFCCSWAMAREAAADTPADPGAPRSDWWHEANPQITVHDHSFYRVTLNNIGCQLRVRLYVDAPFERYRDPDEAKNHYRFRALLKLAGGRSITSPPFANDAAGLRVFAFTHDSSAEGCWVKEPRKLRKLDVNACRGQGCGLEAFK